MERLNNLFGGFVKRLGRLRGSSKYKKRRRCAILILLFFVMQNCVFSAFPQQINYQGKLTDNNNIPVSDGTYSIVFTIYDAASSGDSKWTETQSVTTESGFFNVVLGSDTSIGTDVFDGNDRWLAINVASDGEMDPRQKLTSVGNAFHAYNADKLDGHDWSEIPAGGDYVLKAGDTMTGTLTMDVSSHYGVFATTSNSGGNAFYGSATASGAVTNYGGHFLSAGNSGAAVLGNATAGGAVQNYGGYFLSGGDSGRGVYGWADKSGAVVNYGGYFLSEGDSGRGVYGESSGASGYGVYGNASATGAVTNYGAYFKSDGNSGYGVYGGAHASGAVTNYGGFFLSSGNSGRAVYGWADTPGAVANYGGYFKSEGDLGYGVYGKSVGATGYGVYGEATESGGYAGYFTGGKGVKVVGTIESSSGGVKFPDASIQTTAVSGDNYVLKAGDTMTGTLTMDVSAGHGISATTSHSSGRGVYGESSGASGFGVYGNASATGAVTNYGGHFVSDGNSGQGVYGGAHAVGAVTNYGGFFLASGDSGRAVRGWADTPGAVANYGGYFVSEGDLGYGVYGKSVGATGYGVYGEATESGGYAGYFTGGKGVKVVGTIESTLASGNAPLIVASDTLVANLNADKLDGHDWSEVPSGSDYVLKAGDTMTGILTTEVDAHFATSSGSVGIGTAEPSAKLEVVGGNAKAVQLESTVAPGTAPLVVASDTLVTNLNADLLDGHEWSEVPAAGDYVLKAGDTMTGTLTLAAGATDKIMIDAVTTDHTGTDGVLDIDVDAGATGVIGINSTVVSKGNYSVTGIKSEITSGGMSAGKTTIGSYIAMADHVTDAGNSYNIGQAILNSASTANAANIYGQSIVLNTAQGGADLIGTGNKAGYNVSLVDAGGTGNAAGLQLVMENITKPAGNFGGLSINMKPKVAGITKTYGIKINNSGSETGDVGFELDGAWADGIDLTGATLTDAIKLGTGDITYLDNDGIIQAETTNYGVGNNLTLRAGDGLDAGASPQDGGILSLYGGAKDNAGTDGYVRVGSSGAPDSMAVDDDSLYVKGNLEVDGLSYFDDEITVAGTIESTLAPGKAPLIVASDTLVTNLNADLLDGHDWSEVPSGGDYVLKAGDTMTGDLTMSASSIYLTDGSAAVPALTFTSDPDTGFYFPGAQRFSAVVDGVRRVEFWTTGIRSDQTTSLTSTSLKFRGQIPDGGGAIANKFGNTIALTTAGAKIASFYSDSFSTEKAYIDKDGTIVSSGLVKGVSLESTVVSGTAPLVVASNTLVTNLNADKLDGQHASDFATSSDLNNYVLKAGDTMTGKLTTEVDAHFATSSGSVGIGTTEPGAKLHVEDSSYWYTAQQPAVAVSNYLPAIVVHDINTPGGTRDTMAMYYSTDSGYIGLTEKTVDDWGYNEKINYLELQADGDLVLGSSLGDVGIGTAEPSAKLEVVGGNAKAVQLESTVAPGTAPLVVASNTLVTNLNADLLDGHDWSEVPSGGDYVLKAGDTMTGTLTNSADVHVSGKVGIGDTNPNDKLDVAGSVDITAGSYYKYNGVNLAYADTAKKNYFFGGEAGNLTMTGTYNMGMGYRALYSNTTGANNVAIGHQALYYTTGPNNVGIGYQALYTNADGMWNTGIGYQALFKNTSGGVNNAIGYKALYSNTTGGGNLAFGREALYALTTGNYNTAFAHQAGKNIKTGSGNVFIGKEAGYGGANSAATDNVAIGYKAGYNLAGVGNGANLFFGRSAGWSVTTGTGNILIGGYTDTPLATTTNFLNIGNTIYGLLANPTPPTSGDIGIGTTTPKNRLDVEGAVAIGATYSGTNTAPSNGLLVEGDVGIGTTDPGGLLDIGGKATIEADGDITTSAQFKSTVAPGTAPLVVDSNTLVTNLNADLLDGHEWSEVPSGSDYVLKAGDTMTGVLTTEVDAHFATSSGSVGIGTAGPTAKLHLVGNQILSYGFPSGALNIGANANSTTRSTNTRKLGVIAAPDYTNTKNIELFTSDSISASSNKVYFGGRTGGSAYAATALYFTTAVDTSTTGGTTRMYIDNTGNVGIGTTEPETELVVMQQADGPIYGTGVPITGLRIRGYDDESDKYLNISIEEHGLGVIGGNFGTIYFSPNNTRSVGFNTSGLAIASGKDVRFGDSSADHDKIRGSSDQTAGSTIMFGLNDADDGDYQSRSMIVCDINDIAYNFAHADQADPTMFIHSANQTADEWVSLAHDQANAVIGVGKGHLQTGVTIESTAGGFKFPDDSIQTTAMSGDNYVLKAGDTMTGTLTVSASSGYGVSAKTFDSSGRGVYGYATVDGAYTNYGGYFRAAGDTGQAVYGDASASGPVQNYGGYFSAAGNSGRGVYGLASAPSGTNYGGYFLSASDTGYGVYGRSIGDTGYGVYGKSTGASGYGVYGEATESGGYAGYFTGGLGVKTTGTIESTVASGSAPLIVASNTKVVNLNADLLDGSSSADFAASSDLGNYVLKAGDTMTGTLTISASSSRGIFATTSDSSGYGVYGYATHESGVNQGVYGKTDSGAGYGVYGYASAASGTNYGGCFRSDGNTGRGVYGVATAIGEVTNYGGYFQSAGKFGRGVYGYATGSTGYGVYGYATGSGGRGVYGEAASSTGYGVYGKNGFNYGYLGGSTSAVSGVSSNSGGRGVYGWATVTSGTNYGVYGKTDSSDGYSGYFTGGLGVKVVGTIESTADAHFATSSGNVGIGTATPTSGKLQIATSGSDAVGLYMSGATINRITFGTRAIIGITGVANSIDMKTDGTMHLSGLYLPGLPSTTGSTSYRLYVHGTTNRVYRRTVLGADLAEFYPSKQKLEPAQLVSLDPANPGNVKLTSQAKDPMVIGVVSTQPFETMGDPKDKNPIALAGRVPVYVTDEGGPIAVGDPITSSSTAGKGMRAGIGDPSIGLAIEPCEKGERKIDILISRNNAAGADTGKIVARMEEQIETQGEEIKALKAQMSAMEAKLGTVLDLVEIDDVEGGPISMVIDK